jgi:hypothetical protein
MSSQQMQDFYSAAVKGGIEVVEDSASHAYYMKLKVQYSAAQGETFVKVDRGLADAIFDSLRSGGRISHPETLGKILPKITDGNRYGDGEAILARLLLAGCDDRKTVFIGSKRVYITDKAERGLKHELAAFWGRLGASARWDKEPADVALKGVAARVGDSPVTQQNG